MTPADRLIALRRELHALASTWLASRTARVCEIRQAFAGVLQRVESVENGTIEAWEFIRARDIWERSRGETNAAIGPHRM